MNKARAATLNKALEQILTTLRRDYDPDKVILFGSITSSVIDEWSDIDLVIIKDTPLPFLQRLKEVALLCKPTVGVDFLVYTPEEFKAMIAEQNPFILEEIINKGKILYERPVATVA